MQIVLAAGDEEERDVLTYLLRRSGFSIVASADYSRVLKTWADHPADILIVVSPPKSEPLQVLQTIRQVTRVALILVVEALPEQEFCELLKEGADVVLMRPFSLQVFLAQTRALSRRSATVPAFVLPSMVHSSIALDPSTRTVTVSGRNPVRLTQLEFRLLYTLMLNQGQVIPLEVIVERIWGYSGEGNRDLVRGLVSRLRHKIEDNAEHPQFVETIPGVGYRFGSEVP